MTTERDGQPFSERSRIASVSCEAGKLLARLADGREISAPLDWYPRLANATPGQQRHWKLVGKGCGVHWPDVDEDISVEMLLRGLPSIEARRTTEPASSG